MNSTPTWGEPPAQPSQGQPPQYQPPQYQAPQQPAALTCPKCRGTMRTYERNGIHLEQCDSCRGIFLDFGELESLTQMEARLAQPAPGSYPPQQYGPGWGSHGHHQYRKGGFGRLFFSS